METALPTGFEWATEPDWFGRTIHRATGTEWVALPGGEATVGLSAANRVAKDQLLPPAENDGERFAAERTVEIVPCLVLAEPIGLATVRTTLESRFAGKVIVFGDDDPSTPAYLDHDEVTQLTERLGARLPTEHEWEYFCRAGTTTLFPWGDTLLDAKALAPLVDYPTHTDENPWGLRGLFVGEWTGSLFGSSAASGYVVKGGGSMFWPWQGDGESLFCMPSQRMSSLDTMDGTAAARFVIEM